MTRQQHLAASKMARLNALKNQMVHGILTVSNDTKSVQASLNEMIKN